MNWQPGMDKVQIAVAKGNLVRETEKAYGMDLGLGLLWLPKSQCDLELPASPIQPGTLTIPIWLARKLNIPGQSMVWA